MQGWVYSLMNSDNSKIYCKVNGELGRSVGNPLVQHSFLIVKSCMSSEDRIQETKGEFADICESLYWGDFSCSCTDLLKNLEK